MFIPFTSKHAMTSCGVHGLVKSSYARKQIYEVKRLLHIEQGTSE